MLASIKNKQILIVDRDVAAVEPLRLRLAESGFMVRSLTDASTAAAAVAERPPHLIIVDWDMPGFVGFDLVQGMKQVKAQQDVRLIILSALSGEQDIVAGLDLGADDYISKPFLVREVVARVCVLLRSRSHESDGEVLTCDGLILDTATHRVTVLGHPLNLRGVEYRLLEFLMSNRGRTFNRNQLLSRVWAGDGDVDERTVDVNVQRVRKILSERDYGAYIQTIRGFGYRFSPPTAADGDARLP